MHQATTRSARLATAILENGWGDWATILPLDQNGGFAYGNNAAIRPALQEADPPCFVLLLNPDTIVRPGALKSLVVFMESRPDIGIVGSRLEEPDGTPQQSAFRFPSVLGELEGGVRLGPVSRLLHRWAAFQPIPEEPGPVDWVAGASMIIRRQVFESIGLLDEGYFMYFEEVDFCRRARRAGWPCWYAPSSRVVHLVGQSSGVTDPSRCRSGSDCRDTGSSHVVVTSSLIMGASRRCSRIWPGRWAMSRTGRGDSSSVGPTPTPDCCSGTSSASTSCWRDNDPDPGDLPRHGGRGRATPEPGRPEPQPSRDRVPRAAARGPESVIGNSGGLGNGRVTDWGSQVVLERRFQPSNHDMNHRQLNRRLARPGLALVILAQPPRAVQPTERPLHHPAPRLESPLQRSKIAWRSPVGAPVTSSSGLPHRFW